MNNSTHLNGRANVHKNRTYCTEYFDKKKNIDKIINGVKSYLELESTNMDKKVLVYTRVNM
jgi:hypothetical protein